MNYASSKHFRISKVPSAAHKLFSGTMPITDIGLLFFTRFRKTGRLNGAASFFFQ